MKINFSILAIALLACLPASSATWNDAYGQGANADDSLISAAGIPLAVIQSVQSNSVYHITSAKASGNPRIDSVWIKPDLTGCTVRWYTATNFWTIGSNETAGATTVWLNSTNSGMATNDLVVVHHTSSDSYQLAVISGNATSASGLVSTNAAGYNQIKLFNTVSNAITGANNALGVPGDRIWKLALIRSITPFTLQNVTNDVAAPWGNWWALSVKGNPLSFGGPVGKPSALVLTYSNAAEIAISGDYYVRQRR